MESIMLDNQSMMNPRRSTSVGRGSIDTSRSMIFQSMSTLSQLMNMPIDDYNQPLDSYNNASLYGNHHAPVRPLYSSLPHSFSQSSLVPPLHHNFSSLQVQPPLLPLPNSFTTNHAIPGKKMHTSVNMNNSYKQGGRKKKINRSSTVPKSSKELQSSATINMNLVSKTSSSSEEEFDNGFEGEDESIYSLSPPPSSLPLPSLALMRPRAAEASVTCNTQAVNGSEVADGLRRLLRL